MTRWLCWFAHAWSPWRVRRFMVSGFRIGPLRTMDGESDMQIRECFRCGLKQTSPL